MVLRRFLPPPGLSGRAPSHSRAWPSARAPGTAPSCFSPRAHHGLGLLSNLPAGLPHRSASTEPELLRSPAALSGGAPSGPLSQAPVMWRSRLNRPLRRCPELSRPGGQGPFPPPPDLGPLSPAAGLHSEGVESGTCSSSGCSGLPCAPHAAAALVSVWCVSGWWGPRRAGDDLVDIRMG